jgi:hypothetical protein
MENDIQNTPTSEVQTTPQEVSQPTTQAFEIPRHKSWLVIGIIVLVLLLLGIIVIFVYQNHYLKQQLAQYQTKTTSLAEITKQPEIPSPTPTTDITANWQTYTNEEFKFSFKYPSNFRISNHKEKPFYSLEDTVAFGIIMIQDIYKDMAQTPGIKIQLIQTNKTVNQILDQLKKQVEDDKEYLNNPESTYFGSEPAKINEIETIQDGDIMATKVQRYQGPGAPNAEILEYYIKSPDYVFILEANYGTNNPEIGQDGMLEKETLSKILATFKLL